MKAWTRALLADTERDRRPSALGILTWIPLRGERGEQVAKGGTKKNQGAVSKSASSQQNQGGEKEKYRSQMLRGREDKKEGQRLSSYSTAA